MTAPPPKHGPAPARSSTVRTDRGPLRRRGTDNPLVFLDRGPAPILKTRLQTAYQVWRARSGGNREAFAELLGVSFSALKHYLGDSDPTAPAESTVFLAEAAADEAASEKSNDEIALLWRVRHLVDLELGEEAKRMRRRLLYRDAEEEAA